MALGVQANSGQIPSIDFGGCAMLIEGRIWLNFRWDNLILPNLISYAAFILSVSFYTIYTKIWFILLLKQVKLSIVDFVLTHSVQVVLAQPTFQNLLERLVPTVLFLIESISVKGWTWCIFHLWYFIFTHHGTKSCVFSFLSKSENHNSVVFFLTVRQYSAVDWFK